MAGPKERMFGNRLWDLAIVVAVGRCDLVMKKESLERSTSDWKQRVKSVQTLMKEGLRRSTSEIQKIVRTKST